MELTERFGAVFLDLDGVVYIGRRAVPGAVETIAELRRRSCALRFLTNDPRPSRTDVVLRLRALGVQASAHEVMTCGWATARTLNRRQLRTVFVVGSDALGGELADAGLQVRERGPVDAVVVGCDRDVGYVHIREAANRVRDGAAFLATNNDPVFPTARGLVPGTGAIVAAVRVATGVPAEVIGKPQPAMFEEASASVSPGTPAVMVGDTPATDIEGAHRAGLPAVLFSARGETAELPLWQRPDAVIRSLPDLLKLDARLLQSWEQKGAVPPRRISPCVGAVILDGAGRVLFVRRRDNGLWALPTGHVEPGETWAEAVLREVEEETGLRLAQPLLRGLYSNPVFQVVRFADGRVEHFVAACFLLHTTRTDLVLAPAEVTDARFFPIDRLPHPRVQGHEQWIKDALSASVAPAVR